MLLPLLFSQYFFSFPIARIALSSSLMLFTLIILISVPGSGCPRL